MILLHQNSIEGLTNQHNCTRIGFGRLKMTSLSQNWWGDVKNDTATSELTANSMGRLKNDKTATEHTFPYL